MNPQGQLARFGDIADAAVPAVIALLEDGYDLVGPRYGGPDIHRDGKVPDWFLFMMDVARCRYGSEYTGDRRHHMFGLGQGLVEERLAVIGLSLEEITRPTKSPDISDRIRSHSWLWGYSEERRSRFPSQRERVGLLTSEARRRQLSGDSNGRVDVVGIESRFGAIAKAFGFEIQSTRFNFGTVFHRSPRNGMGTYLRIKVGTDKKIPYPASISLEVMPDIDFVGLDPWFASPYEDGWLFKSLSLLGIGGSYTTGYDSATFALCLDANESFLKAVLPVIVAVCDNLDGSAASCP